MGHVPVATTALRQIRSIHPSLSCLEPALRHCGRRSACARPFDALPDGISYGAVHSEGGGIQFLELRPAWRVRARRRAPRVPADAGVGVAFFDLKRPKTIIDAYGHAEGDDVLGATAQRTARTLDRSDTAARRRGWREMSPSSRASCPHGGIPSPLFERPARGSPSR